MRLSIAIAIGFLLGGAAVELWHRWKQHEPLMITTAVSGNSVPVVYRLDRDGRVTMWLIGQQAPAGLPIVLKEP